MDQEENRSWSFLLLEIFCSIFQNEIPERIVQSAYQNKVQEYREEILEQSAPKGRLGALLAAEKKSKTKVLKTNRTQLKATFVHQSTEVLFFFFFFFLLLQEN
jgi:hypothetical protein